MSRRSGMEWLAAALLTLLSVSLYTTNLRYAGGLWRDEAGVVRLATLAEFQETCARLGHESCPVVFPAMIRIWSKVFGNDDIALRGYGFLVGVLLLSAIWLHGWWTNRSIPWIALGLLAANLAVIRWGASLRAYGTGSVLMLLAAGLVWRYVENPTRGRWLAAAMAAVLSVQCLFQNAVLVLAVCTGAAAAVGLRRRNARQVLAGLAIGVPAALSLLPYWGIIRAAREWSVLSQVGFVPGLIWRNLSQALAPSVSWLKWIWVLLALAAMVRCVTALRQSRAKDSPPDGTILVAVYGTISLWVGVIAFFGFLWISGLPTQVWYYVPLITFAAVCLQAALAGWPGRFPFWQWVLPVVALVLLPGAWRGVQERQTNMDLVASFLHDQAGPDDLIIVHPWNYGISFERYDSGKTPWTTVPPIADHRFHRYDLLKERMQLENPAGPVLERIAATLRSGHRVWVVGSIPFTGEPPPRIRPAPDNPWGWLDDPYSRVWAAQVGYFLVTRAERGDAVPVPTPTPVHRLENAPLAVVSGWRDSETAR